MAIAPLSGFPEWLPSLRMVEQHLLDQLRNTFESWGFVPIETRAVEPLEQMLSKGEIDKEVYLVRRLHAQGDQDAGRELGLHFDLTVPFARYVVENAGKLTFPFRRYQIQKVWRGERPQEGRYREFCQADIDVVAQEELPFHYDVEVAQVMTAALAALPLPPVRLLINNRRLIEGFYRGIGADDPAAVMRAIDKLDKMPVEGVRDMLHDDAKLDERQADLCLALAEISGNDAGVADAVRALGVTHLLLEQGLSELMQVLDGVRDLVNEKVDVVADLRIARGLDYYTGTVYETRMKGLESLGSVCSGGRYESLASSGKTTYPGVGISFGVTRTLAPLFARGVLSASRDVPTCVLVAVTSEETRSASAAAAAALRGRGIATEIAPAAEKFGKQIKYADRRGIPFVWFIADDGSHTVKDIRTGTQLPATPTTWDPPAEDREVRIVVNHEKLG